MEAKGLAMEMSHTPKEIEELFRKTLGIKIVKG